MQSNSSTALLVHRPTRSMQSNSGTALLVHRPTRSMQNNSSTAWGTDELAQQSTAPGIQTGESMRSQSFGCFRHSHTPGHDEG
eukprot:1141639-Pelagomonas_calceolata.AAC.1